MKVQTENLDRRKIPENTTKLFTLEKSNVLWRTCALVQVSSLTERKEHTETYKDAEIIQFRVELCPTTSEASSLYFTARIL